MAKVHLGKGLDFDAHALATSVWAALGIRGSGKSNLAAVIAEGILDAGIPVVVIDCVGPWFSLRLDADGKQPSRFKVPVLGGVHGDIALLPTAGKQVAEALAASNSSAVLDISMMGKGERIRFAAEFVEAFFEAKKRHPGPVSVIVEESQRLIPQTMRFADPYLSRCLGAFEEMAEVGRNFGIGVGLLSLRPQKINKDVLNLAETVAAFRTLGVLERKAIAEWVQEKGAQGRAEVSGELPSLERGSAIVWSPSVFGVYGKFKLALKSTYDASATPDKAKASVKMTALDLASLESAMGQAVADAKANDPKALRARIAELERETKKRATTCDHAGIDQELARWKHVAEVRGVVIADIKKYLGLALSSASNIAARVAPAPVAPQSPLINPDRHKTWRETPKDVGDMNENGGQMRMLRALAGTRKDSLSRREIGALADVKSTGGTFGTYLSRLRGEGLIESGGEGFRITDAGRAKAGHVEQPTGRALLEWWKPKLGDKPARMLETLVDAPEPLTRDYLAESCGLAGNAGTFGTYLSRLISRGLVERAGRGMFRAADVFGE